MSEFKLSDTLEISVDEAKNIIKKFFASVPKVHKFLEYNGKTAAKNMGIRTPPPYGRIRFFENHNDVPALKASIERKGKNAPKLYGRIKLIT